MVSIMKGPDFSRTTAAVMFIVKAPFRQLALTKVLTMASPLV
jgi:hypothetical protein